MYEWLASEIQEIKTAKFHRVEGRLDAKRRRAIVSVTRPVPPSYKAFALRFGGSELYRCDDLDLYRVTVFAPLREVKSRDGEQLYLLGKNGSHFTYFKKALLKNGKESPVFECIEPSGYLRPAADDFESWLKKRCAAARKSYGKNRWAEIVNGPEAFNPFELRIVEARRRYRWRAVGVAKNGDIEFEIHNGSSMMLPYLSIGIDDEDGVLGGGGAFLPVKTIRPGETKKIAFDCYKDVVPAERIKLFEFPEPGPEDRAFYWEFRAADRPTNRTRAASPRKKR